ncbi:MAG: tyrosine-protein phosphatase [Acidiphilium sp.]
MRHRRIVLVPAVGRAGEAALTLALSLAGAPNFRAVPAYRTQDGRHLRPASLFRSGECSALTAADFEQLDALDIRLICDLRSEDERRRFPTRWHAPVRIITLPAASDHGAGMASLLERLLAQPGPAGARQTMIDLYAALPLLLMPILRQQIGLMLSGSGLPSLLHCHVGKDRTGVAVAMLLQAVGVPLDQIFDDYQETNRRLDIDQIYAALGRAVARKLGAPVDRVTLETLGRADPDYLQAALRAIEQGYGGFGRYWQALGFTPEQRAALADLMLE